MLPETCNSPLAELPARGKKNAAIGEADRGV
jgi:hypothetical protein